MDGGTVLYHEQMPTSLGVSDNFDLVPGPYEVNCSVFSSIKIIYIHSCSY